MVQDQWLQQKMKLLLGYNLKIVIQWGQWTFGGRLYWGKFWLVTSLHHPSRENPVYWIYFENYFASGSGVRMYNLIAWGFTSYKSFITPKLVS